MPVNMTRTESDARPDTPLLCAEHTIPVKQHQYVYDLNEAADSLELKNQHHQHTEPLFHTVNYESVLKGYLLVALSSIVFGALTTALLRHATNDFGFRPQTILFAVGAVNLLISAPLLLLIQCTSRSSFALEEWKGVLLLLRGVAGSASNLMFFEAVQRIPAGTAAALFSLRKLITVLLAAFFLAEPFDCVDILSALIGAAGVTIIARPQVVNSHDPVPDSDKMLGMILAIGSASCTSAALVAVRALGRSTSFLYPILAMSVFALALSLLMGGATVAYPLLLWTSGSRVVLLASLSHFCAACCLNLGLQRCRAGPAVFINSLDVPMVDVWAALLLGETPTASGLVGTVLLVSAAVVVSFKRSQS